MKKIALALSAAALLAIPTAASAAPGQDIKAACGASFGQIVSSLQPGFQLGQHGKGGANAFSAPASLAAHGCGGDE